MTPSKDRFEGKWPPAAVFGWQVDAASASQPSQISISRQGVRLSKSQDACWIILKWQLFMKIIGKYNGCWSIYRVTHHDRQAESINLGTLQNWFLRTVMLFLEWTVSPSKINFVSILIPNVQSHRNCHLTRRVDGRFCTTPKVRTPKNAPN